jgi:Ca2+-binding RTX toxin-like protein
VAPSRTATLLASLALVALGLAALAPAAGAETTCEYIGGAEVLYVKMSAEGDAALLALGGGGAIQVRGHGPVLNCGGSPTLANTEFIDVFDESGSGNTTLSVLEAPSFAAGVGMLVSMGEGPLDTLQVSGTAGADHIVLGAAGINFDGAGGADLTYVGTAPEEISANGGSGGGDVIDARGGTGTGTAVGTSLELTGSSGNDTIYGGEAGDSIKGSSGNDALHGEGGNDGLVTSDPTPTSEDTFDGGPGADRLGFSIVHHPLTIDLGKTTPQQTGEGNDTITGVENVTGGEFDDTLIGDAGTNELFGERGDDTLEGGGGDDHLRGGLGTDTVGYANASSGVTVNLSTKTATGEGTDTIEELENVTGSSFGDTLTGNGSFNRIKALGGNDLVNVRDNGGDEVSCGSGVDKAIADRHKVDTIQADCEEVDATPEPGSGGSGGGSSGGLLLVASVAHRQRLAAKGAVLVKVSCPRVACTVVAGASSRRPKMKLKKVTKRLSAGVAKKLKLRLGRTQRNAIALLLSAGKKPKLKVSVSAKDAAGNVAHRSLTVTAKP